ncbi:hypothetical protein [Acinetobacter indicus]|uniref:hypothetical protein n=1 Tax=Acinetobacter indicus TaxID=756892 RepID=UPI000CECC0D9|nr:hypothetical protein [Acinetobacter indicus]
MKKVLQPLLIVALATPALAFANTQTTTPEKVQAAVGVSTTQAVVNNDQVTVASPRTGIRYTFANPNKRPIVLQTAAIAPANAANADRIVASNPALSAESQQKAKQALLNEAAQLAKN